MNEGGNFILLNWANAVCLNSFYYRKLVNVNDYIAMYTDCCIIDNYMLILYYLKFILSIEEYN